MGGPESPGPVPVAAGPTGRHASPARRDDWPAGTPIWLLDVDGVLNAVTRQPDAGVWDDYRCGHATARGRRWPITWSPTVTGMVRDLHESRAMEVLWLTTWEDDANGDLADLLAVPRLPVAGRVADTGDEWTRGWWKLQVARRVADGGPGRPILWTDDDLAYDTDATVWIGSRGVGISPATSRGLDGAHLRTIAEFARTRGGR